LRRGFEDVPEITRRLHGIAAIRTCNALQRGPRKGGNPEARKTKIRLDRQIAAIATVPGATAIYSDDSDVPGYAAEAAMGLIGARTCRCRRRIRRDQWRWTRPAKASRTRNRMRRQDML